MMERACPRACSNGVCPTGLAFAAKLQRLKQTRKLIEELLETSIKPCELSAKATECWQNLCNKKLKRKLSLEETLDLAYVAQIDIRFRRQLDTG